MKMTTRERAKIIVLAAKDVVEGNISEAQRKVNFYRRECFYESNGDFERFIAMIFKFNSYNT